MTEIYGTPIFLTDGNGEAAHGDSDSFRRLGLDYGQVDGCFHPLTEQEWRLVNPSVIQLPDGNFVHMAYSVLYEGKKYLCPCIEYGFYLAGNDGFIREAGNCMKLDAARLTPAIVAIGGYVIPEFMTTDERHTLMILIPMDWALENTPTYARFKTWLEHLVSWCWKVKIPHPKVFDMLNDPQGSFEYFAESDKIKAVSHEEYHNVELAFDHEYQALAHKAFVDDVDDQGEPVSAPYEVQWDGKKYVVNYRCGPGGDTILHLYRKGKFVCAVETGITL